MDRARFEHLLEAFGADFRRWPAQERAAAAAFKLQYGRDYSAAIEQARALDALLDAGGGVDLPSEALAARILAGALRPREIGADRRALWALAACAVFGVLLGYGGGRLAPSNDAADYYIALAFEAPIEALGEDG